MKKYFEILRKCPLFNDIEDENITALLKCLGAKVEKFDKKYTVMAEGNPAKYIGIVLSGAVQIIQEDYYGNRTIISGVEKSEMFAEAYACAEMSEIPVTIIATKTDKIGITSQQKQRNIILEELDLVVGDEFVMFSNVTKVGKDEVYKKIKRTI